MNIGIFTDTYLPDINGVSTSIMTVESGLKTLGHKTLMFAPNRALKYEAFPEKNIWRFPSLPFYGEKNFRFVVPYFSPKNLKSLGIDIVHTQTPFSIGYTGLRFAKRNNIRSVHTYHTRYQEYAHYIKFISPLVKKQIMAAIIRFVNKHDAVITPSRAIKTELESFGVTKPISIIPTGIDIKKITSLANSVDSNAIMKKFNINPNDEIVIFTSRLAREKNIEFLLNSLKSVMNLRPQVRFVIVGDGDYRKNLEVITSKLGLKDKVIFTGFMKHEEIFPIYKVAKVFVFASLTETQGLAALEAMTSGLPLVALKATGIEDLLVNDKGGFLINEKDTDIFSKAILSLLENEDLYKIKSAEAYERANDFSIEKTTKALIDVYNNVGPVVI